MYSIEIHHIQPSRPHSPCCLKEVNMVDFITTLPIVLLTLGLIPVAVFRQKRGAIGLSKRRHIAIRISAIGIVLTMFGAFSSVAQADDTTWTSRTSAADNEWNSVTWGGPTGQEKFVAVSDTGTANRVMTSPDGITWTSRIPATDSEWNSVTWGNGLFVAVADFPLDRVMTSPDGITWTSQTAAVKDWYSVVWGNGKFVAVGSSVTFSGAPVYRGEIMTSPDGITWTTQTSTASDTWRSVAYANGIFVAVSATGVVKTSPDGTNWTSQTPAVNNPWNSVTWGGLAGQEKFVAVSCCGVGNRAMTSPDGITWTAQNSTVSNRWNSVIWGGSTGQEKFVAVSETGTANRVMTLATTTIGATTTTAAVTTTTTAAVSATVTTLAPTATTTTVATATTTIATTKKVEKSESLPATGGNSATVVVIGLFFTVAGFVLLSRRKIS